MSNYIMKKQDGNFPKEIDSIVSPLSNCATATFLTYYFIYKKRKYPRYKSI